MGRKLSSVEALPFYLEDRLLRTCVHISLARTVSHTAPNYTIGEMISFLALQPLEQRRGEGRGLEVGVVRQPAGFALAHSEQRKTWISMYWALLLVLFCRNFFVGES